VLVVAVLAGCTGEPAPTTTPLTFEPYTPTPTPTPEPDPDPDDATVPPERPDLSQVDAETAQALAVYFLQLYPYVYATGDLTDWRALSHPECIFCASVIGNVEKMLASGTSAGGGAISTDLRGVELSPGVFGVEGIVTQEPGLAYDAYGNVIDQSDGGRYEVALNLHGSSSGWLVRAVEIRTAS